MRNKPKTRYPLRLEESYAKNIQKSIKEIEKVSLYEFDKHLAPMIDDKKLVNDSSFINDGLFDVASKLIKKAQTYFLGILQNRTAQKIVCKHINSVNAFNKSNVNAQLAVRGINPLQTEPWLNNYVQTKIAENVSYVTNIRDDYSKKFEQIIYRGITEGKSSSEIREELVHQAGMSSEKAAFIARDQTGTILGQMNSERQQRAGFRAFEWSDSRDEKVRVSHEERNGKIYFYADNPLLPGEEYGCRCVANPVDDEELLEQGIEFGLSNSEEHAVKTYVSSEAYKLNDKLRNGYQLDESDIELMNNLDKALGKISSYKGEVTRSMFFESSDDLVRFANNYNLNDVVQFPEYISTTKDIYSEQDSLRFVILSSTGKDLGSYNKSEKEVLFKRDAKFIVKDRYLLDGKPFIVLEEYHE
ncbi:minor capsid protein [Enterococcus faecalis]|uniref:minor capsid protein n=1 Tax=Enterococcus faecalis TaxID=1351 RepID=UPI0021C89EBA|nr:minor capsid protein [Enterococcus faecalis]MCU2207827.1 minor capsid protein [Enterococcus faecalis]